MEMDFAILRSLSLFFNKQQTVKINYKLVSFNIYLIEIKIEKMKDKIRYISSFIGYFSFTRELQMYL